MTDRSFASLREAMVTTQIERRGIADPRVLAAMRAVPRELFVPQARADEAYDDRALPIGAGQTVSQPYMVAVMTQALRLTPTSRVLEVGTGSGYQAAILGSIAASVVSIERLPALAEAARQRLAALGFDRVTVVVGDGTDGYPPAAPYDAIVVTAGAPHVPGALRDQLADGGRLVVPVGTARQQDLQVIERRGGTFLTSAGDGCIFVPLVGRDGWPG